MKRVVRYGVMVAAVVATVTAGPTAMASESPAVANTAVVQQQNDDDQDRGDDHGLWGLLGLLGLVGLVGLIRRGRSNDRLAGPAAEPPVAESEVITRRPTDYVPSGPSAQPQQYVQPRQQPAAPPDGYRQP